MKKYPLLAVLCLVSGIAFGQTKLPPAYLITADTAQGNISLPDSCWQMLADPSGKMTLQQAIHSDLFQDTSRKIDYRINTYWLRFRLANKMAKPTQITLWMDKVQYANLYVRSDSTDWQHYKTGTLVPWSRRDGLKSLKAVTLTIPAGKSLIVYEKHTFDYIMYGYFSGSVEENASFSFTQRVVQQQRSHYIYSTLIAFVLGLILLAVAINLYFYIIVREKEFLYFTLFISTFWIIYGSGIDDIFFKDHPSLIYYLILFSGPFIEFLLIYSVRHFLKTFSHFPRWDKYLIVLSFLTVITSFLTGFAPAFLHKNFSLLSIYINVGLALLANLSLLITIFLYRRNRDRIVRLVTYALAPFAIMLSINCILVLLRLSKAITGFLLVVQQIDHIIYPISLVWMIVLFACILFMRFSMLRRKYAQEKLAREQERSALIEKQKAELEIQVAERTSELSQSLENLKSTQKQLIQSEKMASLGELTAGIAHEIQNPLNFVNNFSEVNTELIEELNEERKKGIRDFENEDEILKGIKENSEKIIHHGKRADAIVKGMLQHSRTSTGKKEPTNINALADEYLRLSYHGMRAKDKTFNATMKTDFDETIGKINIVPQDIGRVLLNLFNNAFYACAERSRSSTGLRQAQPDSSDTGSSTDGERSRSASMQEYIPTVWVSIKKLDGKIEISVKDNGNGIPEKAKDKIFQPFFTTKPTGEGTGLGLSLSYDMIKAHDGEISVNTKEGEARPDDPVGRGTEFVIQLPA